MSDADTDQGQGCGFDCACDDSVPTVWCCGDVCLHQFHLGCCQEWLNDNKRTLEHKLCIECLQDEFPDDFGTGLSARVAVSSQSEQPGPAAASSTAIALIDGLQHRALPPGTGLPPFPFTKYDTVDFLQVGGTRARGVLILLSATQVGILQLDRSNWVDMTRAECLKETVPAPSEDSCTRIQRALFDFRKATPDLKGSNNVLPSAFLCGGMDYANHWTVCTHLLFPAAKHPSCRSSWYA